MPCRCSWDTGDLCTLRPAQRHEWQHGECQVITLGTAGISSGMLGTPLEMLRGAGLDADTHGVRAAADALTPPAEPACRRPGGPLCPHHVADHLQLRQRERGLPLQPPAGQSPPAPQPQEVGGEKRVPARLWEQGTSWAAEGPASTVGVGSGLCCHRAKSSPPVGQWLCRGWRCLVSCPSSLPFCGDAKSHLLTALVTTRP